MMNENIFTSEPLFYYEGNEKSVECNYSDEFVETALLLMNEYVANNYHLISDPDFCECMEEELFELFISQLEDLLFDDENEEEFESMVEYSIDYFYENIFPRKSEDTNTFIDRTSISTDAITQQIQTLQVIPQPAQRTQEWYDFRHNLITASNAYKVFESQSVQNQLIYEKCQPLKVVDVNSCSGVNIHTTLHWGQKYEPVSAMIYEDMYHTKLGDFGCIKHRHYKCIAASPDGINIDTTTVRYGRMIEIKNIVNREINGNPKKEYWVQMQLQMEICDLDECDFLETQFVEYENESDFISDSDTNEDPSTKYTRTKEGCYKGMIMYFADSNGNPIYKYKDVNMMSENG
jgi:putative phage-type endonuclease